MSQTDILPIPDTPSARKIGWGIAALVVAGNMIGSGVYLAPVALASTGSSSLIGWLICGAGAMILAAVFAGLGRFQPDADGLSDFTRRGMGRFIGYQTGLAYWAACLAGNVALAVAGGTKRAAAPCGACRQALAEFCAPELPVFIARLKGGQVKAAALGELLPLAFADLT